MTIHGGRFDHVFLTKTRCHDGGKRRGRPASRTGVPFRSIDRPFVVHPFVRKRRRKDPAIPPPPPCPPFRKGVAEPSVGPLGREASSPRRLRLRRRASGHRKETTRGSDAVKGAGGDPKRGGRHRQERRERLARMMGNVTSEGTFGGRHTSAPRRAVVERRKSQGPYNIIQEMGTRSSPAAGRPLFLILRIWGANVNVGRLCVPGGE
jgi:hypothetical protein